MSLLTYLQKMPLQQKKAGRLLLYFFALMLVFTLLSRGVDSFVVAAVTTMKPVEGNLTRKLTVTGTVQPLGEVAVAVPEGFLVRRVLVEEGSRIKEGDLLAELDLTSVKKKMADARRELALAQLDAELDKLKAHLPNEDPLEKAELALERAKEDLETAKQTSSEKIARAQSDLSKARRDLRDVRDNDHEDKEVEDAKRDVLQQEWAVEDAHRDAEATQLAAERAVEDAKRGIEEAQRDKEKQEASQAMDDQTQELKNRISALSMQEKQSEVQEMETVLATEGKIRATQSGIITKLHLEPGNITGSGAAFRLGEETTGSLFRAQAEEDVGKHLSLGDVVSITSTGVKPITAPITALTPPKEKGGSYTVTVDLADVQITPGSACTLTIEKTGDQKGYVIPLAALHGSDAGKHRGYLYVVREKNTTMGTQTVAEKLDVDVLDQSATAAIVRGPLTREDRIIEYSSRSLTQGDRVRTEDEK